ncbi:hypothetical protein PAGU1678_13670 [Paraclostridium bifermentans subsp. muricolitidis]|nr:hypothetical protein PAGU1678_13670 [Paraclostridium bifermentans subsp. muricolitidis]
MYLGIKGYKVKEIDASESAINKCKELANKNLENVEFEVEEIINLDNSEITKYKWIYAVGVLHMLVDDNDRNLFLKSIYNMLDRGGHALLVNMGNGEVEMKLTHLKHLKSKKEIIIVKAKKLWLHLLHIDL